MSDYDYGFDLPPTQEEIDEAIQNMEDFFTEIEKAFNVQLIGNRLEIPHARQDFAHMSRAHMWYIISTWKANIYMDYAKRSLNDD